MSESLNPQGNPAVLTEMPRYEYAPETARPGQPLGVPGLNLLLFGLTLITTTMAGAYIGGGELTMTHPLTSLAALFNGLSFSIPLLAILLFHELGHFITARRNGVAASYPYFIPAPFPSLFIIGTFGAFIRMKSPPRSRRVMFDVGAAGPWAGMILAIPFTILGLKMSTVLPMEQAQGGLELGNSIVFWSLARWTLGVDPNSVMVNMHAIAFAGWIGMFVTSLNLLPVGQLDGGHVIYALFGRRHRLISRLFVLTAIMLVVVPYLMSWHYWAGWILWVAILLMLGLGHPTTIDADTPLDPRRRLFAWATIVLFVITFIPVPLSFTPPPGQPGEKSQVYDVITQPPAPPTAHTRAF
jgi:membrane-associated protease RseP (regulator of RpoE activity)